MYRTSKWHDWFKSYGGFAEKSGFFPSLYFHRAPVPQLKKSIINDKKNYKKYIFL